MTLVKPVSNPADRHVAHLLGATFDALRTELAADDWGGLRPSHLRVIEAVPDDGISITELATRVRMTKQGCGQFVAELAGSGHLRTSPDPSDKRARIVRRTAKGTRVSRRALARIQEIEAAWEQTVGATAYATFRTVLEALGTPR